MIFRIILQVSFLVTLLPSNLLALSASPSNCVASISNAVGKANYNEIKVNCECSASNSENSFLTDDDMKHCSRSCLAQKKSSLCSSSRNGTFSNCCDSCGGLHLSLFGKHSCVVLGSRKPSPESSLDCAPKFSSGALTAKVKDTFVQCDCDGSSKTFEYGVSSLLYDCVNPCMYNRIGNQCKIADLLDDSYYALYACCSLCEGVLKTSAGKHTCSGESTAIVSKSPTPSPSTCETKVDTVRDELGFKNERVSCTCGSDYTHRNFLMDKSRQECVKTCVKEYLGPTCSTSGISSNSYYAFRHCCPSCNGEVVTRYVNSKALYICVLPSPTPSPSPTCKPTVRDVENYRSFKTVQVSCSCRASTYYRHVKLYMDFQLRGCMHKCVSDHMGSTCSASNSAPKTKEAFKKCCSECKGHENRYYYNTCFSSPSPSPSPSPKCSPVVYHYTSQSRKFYDTKVGCRCSYTPKYAEFLTEQTIRKCLDACFKPKLGSTCSSHEFADRITPFYQSCCSTCKGSSTTQNFKYACIAAPSPTPSPKCVASISDDRPYHSFERSKIVCSCPWGTKNTTVVTDDAIESCIRACIPNRLGGTCQLSNLFGTVINAHERCCTTCNGVITPVFSKTACLSRPSPSPSPACLLSVENYGVYSSYNSYRTMCRCGTRSGYRFYLGDKSRHSCLLSCLSSEEGGTCGVGTHVSETQAMFSTCCSKCSGKIGSHGVYKVCIATTPTPTPPPKCSFTVEKSGKQAPFDKVVSKCKCDSKSSSHLVLSDSSAEKCTRSCIQGKLGSSCVESTFTTQIEQTFEQCCTLCEGFVTKKNNVHVCADSDGIFIPVEYKA